MSIETAIRELALRWDKVPAGERANYQLYLLELAEALDVPRPDPKGSGYEFEYPVAVVNPNGLTTSKFADIYRAGHFLLEAKDENAADSRDILLRRAFGQARMYAAWVTSPPPYLLVLDVGRTLVVWDRWSGSYGDYHAGHRIHLPTLAERPDDIDLLRDIWTDPAARDPRGRAEAITREVAADLARLSASLEERGHDPEVVARFLIRCVFSMFAEDVGLLQDGPFRHAIEEIGLDDPAEFRQAVRGLWEAMDKGGRFGLRKFLRFNGHFFEEQTVLPLTVADLQILLAAAEHDWSDVEPSIMGTLLTRALDPTERHKLGAEYTPREFVERLVRPAVEEPIRERWTRVQAEVLQLRPGEGKGARNKRSQTKKALESLRGFHAWLRSLRFLDPAAGSGNFLYVTMNLVKQVELEVLRAIEEITGNPELAVEEVGPWQFHGIEVKAWARELAELTLWIGFHQWWRRTHGHVQPPEPVLRDTGMLEHRDAVLAWDELEEDPAKARPDPNPSVRDSVTGKLVPDASAMLPYTAHVGARQAPWPPADFVIGNPPYIGNKRMRDALGDGYVDALREAYQDVPESADYVMYWWHRAAMEVAEGRAIRAGLITTNSITQTYNRQVIAQAVDRGAKVIWAIPTHPWVDETGSAAVRVAMTIIARESVQALRIEVDDHGQVTHQVEVDTLNADLTAHADITGAASEPLRSNAGLSSRGFTLVGRGFVLDAAEARELVKNDPRNSEIIRPYLSGRDLTRNPRGMYVIDFGTRAEKQARDCPVLYDLVRSRVKPHRAANNDKKAREAWWLFGRNREEFRAALVGVDRFIATPYVAKHRFFTFLDAGIAPDETIVCVASGDAFVLGVLSSTMHVEWALAAGSRLGIGNDPRYNNSQCFDPFPFPDPTPEIREMVSQTAEQLDHHRRSALARDPKLTVTDIYNVVENLSSGTALTPRQRQIHDSAACGVLRDLHDELDHLLAAAYGWDWPMPREDILSRLVTLHDERAVEEKLGTVRWLRPEYQVVRFGEGAGDEQKLDLGAQAQEVASEPAGWPSATVEQIEALQDVLAAGPTTVESAAGRFRGARREHVERHLETLVIMGEAVSDGGLYQSARPARGAV